MALRDPLFLQDAGYTAAADRLLIGAGLFPAGGAEQYPRCGVRPHGVTSVSDGVELSFKVVDATGVSGFGAVVVERGAAYVPARTALTLNGVYLVVNDSPTTVMLAGGETGVAAALDLSLYLQVLDPEDSLEGSDVAVAVFQVLPTGAIPPASSLLLARCVVPPSGAVDVKDMRTYTTGHGGTLMVETKEELIVTAGGKGLGLVPFGSAAYVRADGLTYTRTKRGWEAYGAVASGGAIPEVGTAYEGQVFYHAASGQLLMFTNGAWVQVGGRMGVARKQVEQEYTGRRHAMTAVNEFKGKLAPQASWTKATSLTPVTGLPTSDAATEVRFQVFSAGTPVVAGVTCEMAVKNDNDQGYSANFGYVALQLLEYVGSTTTGPVAAYPFDVTNAGNYYYSGQRYKAEDDSYKGRTVLYSLPIGEYMLRPMFKVGGSGAMNILHVSGLCVEVSL